MIYEVTKYYKKILAFHMPLTVVRKTWIAACLSSTTINQI